MNLKMTNKWTLYEYFRKIIQLGYENVLDVIHSVHFKSIFLFILGGETGFFNIPFYNEHLFLLSTHSPKFVLKKNVVSYKTTDSEKKKTKDDVSEQLKSI